MRSKSKIAALLAGVALLAVAAAVGPLRADTPAQAASITAVHASWSFTTINPGATRTFVWNNALHDRIYLVDVVPTAASPTTPCQLEIIRQWNLLRVENPITGPGEREVWFTVKNVGNIHCTGKVLLHAFGG